MAKKPSEMTNVEAWNESAHAHRRTWDVCAGMPTLPYPPDPVERVSDEMLSLYGGCHGNSDQRLMALELIERRKADKEQGR